MTDNTPQSGTRQTAAARAASLALRKQTALAENWLPRIDRQPREVWTPELIGELAAILQRKLPAHLAVQVVPIEQARPTDPDGFEYQGTIA